MDLSTQIRRGGQRRIAAKFGIPAWNARAVFPFSIHFYRCIELFRSRATWFAPDEVL